MADDFAIPPKNSPIGIIDYFEKNEETNFSDRFDATGRNLGNDVIDLVESMQAYQRSLHHHLEADEEWSQRGMDVLTLSSFFLGPVPSVMSSAVGIMFREYHERTQNLLIASANGLAKGLIDEAMKDLREEGIPLPRPDEISELDLKFIYQQLEGTVFSGEVFDSLDGDISDKIRDYFLVTLARMVAVTDVSARVRDEQMGERLDGIEDRSDELTLRLAKTEQETTELAKIIDGLRTADLSTRERLQGIANSVSALMELDLELEERIGHLERAQLEFADSLGSIVSTIGKNQSRIESLERESEEVSILATQNSNDIKFIQGLLFGKLNAREKLAAIDGGFSNLDVSDDNRRRLEVLAKFESFEDSFIQIVDVLAASATIASHFGLNPEISERIYRGVKIVDGIRNCAKDILTKPGWGLVSGVGKLFSSIFGGDGARKRHRQVMEALGLLSQGQAALLENQGLLISNQRALSEGQQIIISGIRALGETVSGLYEGQRRIIENQHKIAKQISDLGEFVYESAKAVSEQANRLAWSIVGEIRSVGEDVLAVGDIAVALAEAEISKCDDALIALDDYEKYLEDSIPHSRDSIQVYYTHYGDVLSSCLAGLEAVLDDTNGVHPLLHLRTVRGSLKSGNRLQLDWELRAYGSTFRLWRALFVSPTVLAEDEVYRSGSDGGFPDTREYNPDFDQILAHVTYPPFSREVSIALGHAIGRSGVDNPFTWMGERRLPSISYSRQAVSNTKPITISDFQDYLNVPLVIKLGNWLLKLHHFYSLSPNIVDGQPLYTSEELASHDRVSNRGRLAILKLLRLVSVAIGQQSILSGEMIASFLYGNGTHTNFDASNHMAGVGTYYEKQARHGFVDLEPWPKDCFSNEDLGTTNELGSLECVMSRNPYLASNRLRIEVLHPQRDIEDRMRISDEGRGYSSISPRALIRRGLLENPAPLFTQEGISFANELHSKARSNRIVNRREMASFRPWHFRFSEEAFIEEATELVVPSGWSVAWIPTVGQNYSRRIYVRMPNLDDYDKIVYTPGLSPLVEMRDQILATLGEYHVVDLMNEDEHLAFAAYAVINTN